MKVNKPQGVHMLDKLVSIFPKEKSLQCTTELLAGISFLIDSLNRDRYGESVVLTDAQRNDILDCISMIVLQYKK